jgi:hypothetical protein
MNNISLRHTEKRFKVGRQSSNTINTLIPSWRSKSSAKPEFVHFSRERKALANSLVVVML